MTDSAAAFKAEAQALKNGPAPPGAYNNKMGFDEYAQHDLEHDTAPKINFPFKPRAELNALLLSPPRWASARSSGPMPQGGASREVPPR